MKKHPLLSPAWAFYQPSEQRAINLIAKIAAGPVDDAARVGVPVEKRGTTAIVRTVGPMIKHAGWMVKYGLAGIRDTQAALMSALMDNEIEQILWVMDTPGGTVDGLHELATVVKTVNNSKPITVQVDGMLASAGYYVASQASAIYAGHDDLVGSIGTRTLMIDDSKYYEDLGVKFIPVDTGEFKSTGAPGVPITDRQIADTQRIVDGFFETFLAMIESGRKIGGKDLEAVADGRVFFSQDAVGLGLIDGVRTLGETLTGLAEPAVSGGRSTRAARVKLLKLGA